MFLAILGLFGCGHPYYASGSSSWIRSSFASAFCWVCLLAPTIGSVLLFLRVSFFCLGASLDLWGRLTSVVIGFTPSYFLLNTCVIGGNFLACTFSCLDSWGYRCLWVACSGFYFTTLLSSLGFASTFFSDLRMPIKFSKEDMRIYFFYKLWSTYFSSYFSGTYFTDPIRYSFFAFSFASSFFKFSPRCSTWLITSFVLSFILWFWSTSLFCKTF